MVPVIVLGGIYGGIMTPTGSSGCFCFLRPYRRAFPVPRNEFKRPVACLHRSLRNVFRHHSADGHGRTLFGNIMTLEDVPGTIARGILGYRKQGHGASAD